MRIGSRAVVAFDSGIARKRVTGGFHVALMVMDCGDGMFQQIMHPAVFKTEAEAARLLDRISHNLNKINLNNWIVGNHPCNAYQSKPEDEPLLYCPLPIPF